MTGGDAQSFRADLEPHDAPFDEVESAGHGSEADVFRVPPSVGILVQLGQISVALELTEEMPCRGRT
ncbi:hypothetical protein GCM10010425_37840 [Streptomyces spororaveus]|uniref:Uncharacterized protein n=1 Tax=Streptomyces spororaveus TaxID=284039 RepID=A0ABQ3TPI4_9ACTN|nr:hypothetical protein Sspor_78760 [Streptomyces spororaveus]